MGRSPCCEKVGLKKGPWTPEEDQKLLTYIEEYGHGSWRALPAKAGLQRCGKSCRLRWTNYLRPDIKRGKFSLQEEQTIIQLHALLGNRWSAIATHLPKRTDNEIKNYWNTHLKKRLTKMGIDPVTHKRKLDGLGSGSGHAKDAATISHMAQWESARLEAEARFVRESKLVITNPPQNHLMVINKASSTTTTTAPPSALPCLDVLKAWQGAWSTTKPTTRGGSIMSMDDLESPTSTLNFPHNNSFNFNPLIMQTTIINNGFNENDHVVPCESGVLLQDNNTSNNIDNTYGNCMDINSTSTAVSGAWFVDSAFRSAGNHDYDEGNVIMPTAALSNFLMEGFTDILVYNSEDQNSSLAREVSAGNGGGGDHGSCGSGNLEENRSYWDSILNLVNASPSGSPVF